MIKTALLPMYREQTERLKGNKKEEKYQRIMANIQSPSPAERDTNYIELL